MENPDRGRETVGDQWKLVPRENFLRTLRVGQYVLSKRSSSEVAVAKADKELYEMTAELNRMIDKLLHQPGGGDHPALDCIWNRLERKLIKKFDLYMQVVDKSQLLKFPKNISILDVTPAIGLMYSKIVEVPLADVEFDDPAPQVMGRTEELPTSVEGEEEREADPHQEPAVNVVLKLEQDEDAELQPEPEVNLNPGLEQDGDADSLPELEMKVEQNVEVGRHPEPEVNLDQGSEQDEEIDSQFLPGINDFPPLIPGLKVVAKKIHRSWLRQNGVQAMEVEENIQVTTPKDPENVRLVGCNIKMPPLEDMIEPETKTVYCRNYNESTKLTVDIGLPNQPLKPILKSNSSKIVPKKNVRFQMNSKEGTPVSQNNVNPEEGTPMRQNNINAEELTPECQNKLQLNPEEGTPIRHCQSNVQPLRKTPKFQNNVQPLRKTPKFQNNVQPLKNTLKFQNNVQSLKIRREKKKYKLNLGGVCTRSARKKREEKKTLCFNGILLQPELIDQDRFLRSRLVSKK